MPDWITPYARRRAIFADEAKKRGLPVHLLFAPTRKRDVVQARDAAIRRLRDELGMSNRQIGRVLGMDTSSVWAVFHRARKRAANRRTCRDVRV